MTMESSPENLDSFDWPPNQNGGLFDPVLFDGSRESQDAIVGDGDFTGGFFSDNVALENWSTPLTFNDNLPAVPTSNLIEQVDRLQDGDYGETSQRESKSQMTSLGEEGAQKQEPVCASKLW